MKNISQIDEHDSTVKTDNIKVLCVLNFLPEEGKGNFKEGVYPTIIKAHSEAGINVAVAVQRYDSIEDQIKTCSQLGAKFIVPKDNVKISVILKYAKIMRYTSKKTWIKLFVFIWKNRHMLAGIDEYIKLEGKPDIVAGLTAIENTGISAFLIGKIHDIPYVVRENRTFYTRGLVKGYLKNIISNVVEYASIVFPVSPQLGQNIRKHLVIEPKVIVVLQNPVADNFFNKPENDKWVKDFAKGRFVFAGWTKWRDIKRIDIAIKAFYKLHNNKTDTCLILAGPVPNWAYSMIEKFNLQNSVLLTGPLDRKGIEVLAHNCDCCIVPSDHDPGNNSVLEAMAAGKPVIVTKCGGSESRITDHSLGIVVEKGDCNSFALAMEDVINNIETFNPSQIKAECHRLYSTKVFGAKILSSYNSLMFTGLS